MSEKTELCDLCVKYGTDKVIWGYTPHYHNLFKHKRDDVKAVLEIGICGYRDIPNNVVGASLFVWRDYFPKAEVFGIDNDSKFIFNDKPRIHTALANAYNRGQLSSALIGFRSNNAGSFDFICDDAVHDPDPQLQLFLDLWPCLTPGGVYAIEDVCPYKMPNGDLGYLTDHFPKGSTTEIVRTHKAEVLVLVRKKT